MPNPRELSQFGSFVEVDDTTKNIGIATTGTPFVGIGTLVPQEKLHVVGNLRVDGSFNATSSSIGVAITATSADTRDLNDKLSDYITVKDFGAVGDGSNDDRFALNDCQTNYNLVVFPPGEYFLGGNYTFYRPVIFMPGAKLRMPSSILVTFSSTLQAEPQQIFNILADATVSMGAYVDVGYPEWWGAIPNASNATIDANNHKAITACIKACPITKFRAADYFFDKTLEITTPARRIEGTMHGPVGLNRAGITRLMVTDSTADCIWVHTPNGTNAVSTWYNHAEIEDLLVARSTAITVPAVGIETSGPKGIKIEKWVWCFIRNVQVSEHYIGIYQDKTVRVTMNQVQSFRSSVGIGSYAGINDRFYGYWLDTTENFGLAGGNASTYMTDCTASSGGSPFPRDRSIGFYLKGAFVDSFIQRPETTAVGTGLLFDGVGITTTDSRYRSGFIDVHLVTPVVDQFSVAGVKFTNTSEWTNINVLGGYAAPAGSGIATAPTAGLHIETCRGSINISNWQTNSWPSPSCKGLLIKDSTAIKCQGGAYQGSQSPVVLDGAKKCSVEETIKNTTEYGYNENPTSPALIVKNSSVQNYIRPTIHGSVGIFTTGVYVEDSGSISNEINCTNIDDNSISGSTLVIDGNAVSTPGYKYSNMISGLLDGQGGDFTTTRVAIHRRPPTGRWSFGQNITKIDVNSDDTFNVTTRVGIVTVSIGDAALPPLTVK